MRFHFLNLLAAGVIFTVGAYADCTTSQDGTAVCACATGSPQGEYCGYCADVISCGDQNDCFLDVYECNPGGGCCLYGYRDSCASSASALNFDTVQCPIPATTAARKL